MIETILEQPWWVGILGAIVTIGIGVAWLQSGRREIGWGAVGALILTIILVAVGLVVETERESLRRMIYATAEDLENARACIQEGARIFLGNACWLYLVESPRSISGTLDLGRKRDEGLEHIALETAEVEGDAGELYFEDGIQIFIGDRNRAFATPDRHLGFPIEFQN